MSLKTKAAGKSKAKSPQHVPDKSRRHPATALEKGLLLAVALFVLMRVAATVLFEPGGRIWGLDFSRYILSPFTLVVLLIPLVTAIPAVAQRIGAGLTARTTRVRRWTLPVIAAAVLGGCILFIAYYPVVYSFLGDGAYCHTEVYRLKTIPGHVSPMFDKATAFGTGLLVRFITSAFEFDDNRVPFTVLGFIGIAILVPGLFYLLRKAPRTHAVLLILALLFNPAVLFFFSYVETYALQYVFLALFFASSYAMLTQDGMWKAPAVFLGISIFLGISSVIFIPALLVLIFYHFGWRGKRLQRVAFALCAAVAAAFITLVAVYGFDMTNGYILPVTTGDMVQPNGEVSGWFGYSMFSSAHLIDMLNILLLITGPLAFAALALLAFPAARRNIFASPLVLFAAIAAFAGLCMLLGGNAAYGLARDWDLAAIPATAVVFFFAVMLIQSTERGDFRLGLVLPVLAAAIISGSGVWVALNATPASAERLEAIIDMDALLLEPRITSYGYENIRKYYSLYLDDEQRMRLLEKIIPVGINALDYTDQAISLAVHRKSGAERTGYVTQRILDLIARLKHPYPAHDSRHIDPRLIEEYLASSVLRMYAVDEVFARNLLETIGSAYPEWRYYDFLERATHPENMKAEEIASFVQRAIPIETLDPYQLAYGGGYMRLAGKYDLAALYFEESLKRDAHRHARLYLLLAQLYKYRLFNHDKAIATLSRCLDSCKLSSSFDSIQDTLNKYKSLEASR